MKELLVGFEAMTRVSEEQAVIDGNIHEEVVKNVSNYYRWAIWEILLFGVLVVAQVWIIGKESNQNYSIV